MLINHALGITDEIDALGPAPARKRGTPELNRQIAIVKALRLALPAGAVVFRVENAAKASGRTREQRMRFHAKRKAAGMLPGFPDLAALVPAVPPAPFGRTLLFECKDAGGEPDERQAELHEHLRRIGYFVAVVHDAAEAADAVRAAGLNPRQSSLDR